MRAAIYARKSTEQGGADEARSVTRQVEHARAFARSKGWTVLDAHVYVDDGISGAEFASRPGFVRLMNALKPRPPFDVLVMSEESRLGREAIETAYALKQLIQAGVKVWFYLEGRERTLESPTDKLLMSVAAFADELEREKARQRTYDAMARKARAGHVTGGRVFGYDNVDVCLADGTRSHVERRINEAEAAVVRRIYQAVADGDGVHRIAHRLNAEGVPSPRSQQGRPTGWASSSVHAVLRRPLYRGVIVWNATRKRNQWGQRQTQVRPETEHLTIDAPQLRIIDEPLWQAVQARQRTNLAKYTRATSGKLYGRPRDVESQYLLSGFLKCEVCGSTWTPVSRAHGRKRAHFYRCLASHTRGATVCASGLSMPMAAVDGAVLEQLRTFLGPDVIREAIDEAVTRLTSDDRGKQRERVACDLADLSERQRRLVALVGATGDVQAVAEALKANEVRRQELEARLAELEVDRPALDPATVRRKAEAAASDFHRLLGGAVAQARQILRKLLDGPIRVSVLEHADGIRLRSRINLGALCPIRVASLTCLNWNQLEVWLRAVDGLRQVA